MELCTDVLLVGKYKQSSCRLPNNFYRFPNFHGITPTNSYNTHQANTMAKPSKNSSEPETVIVEDQKIDPPPYDLDTNGLLKSTFDELSILRTLFVFKRVILVSLAVYTGYICEGFEVCKDLLLCAQTRLMLYSSVLEVASLPMLDLSSNSVHGVVKASEP